MLILQAFVESISDSLAAEYSRKGITIQCILPGFVVSKLSKLKRPSLMIPTPTAYVRSTMKTTGVEKRTAGYFMHKLQVGISWLPRWLMVEVFISVAKDHKESRKWVIVLLLLLPFYLFMLSFDFYFLPFLVHDSPKSFSSNRYVFLEIIFMWFLSYEVECITHVTEKIILISFWCGLG